MIPKSGHRFSEEIMPGQTAMPGKVGTGFPFGIAAKE
jgi:hypothetical protein